MRHRALTAALPQGRINAAVGQVLADQAVAQANRMQQAKLARLERLEALCIERRILPLRAYRRAAGNTVVLDVELAVFAYVDPGYESAKALRSWGTAHRGLWKALRKRCRSVGVVAVVRTPRELERAQAILGDWAEASGPAEPDGDAGEEIARIEQVTLQGAVRILDEFGGLQAAMKRSVALKKARQQPGHGPIHRGSSWKTARLVWALTTKKEIYRAHAAA